MRFIQPQKLRVKLVLRQMRREIFEQGRLAGSFRPDDRTAIVESFEPIHQLLERPARGPIANRQHALDAEWILAGLHLFIAVCSSISSAVGDIVKVCRVDSLLGRTTSSTAQISEMSLPEKLYGDGGSSNWNG